MEGLSVCYYFLSPMVSCQDGHATATCCVNVSADVLEGLFVTPPPNCPVVGAVWRTARVPLAYLPAEQFVAVEPPGTFQIPFVSADNMCWPLQQTVFHPTFVTVVFRAPPPTPNATVRFDLCMYMQRLVDVHHQAENTYLIKGNGFTAPIATGGGMVTGSASGIDNALLNLSWNLDGVTRGWPGKHLPASVTDRLWMCRRSLRDVHPTYVRPPG